MKDLKLQLTINDVNNVIKALGQLPYNQVHELITKIHSQATTQLASENGNGIAKENLSAGQAGGKINSETTVN